MMKRLKRLLALALCTATVACTVPFSAAAAPMETGASDSPASLIAFAKDYVSLQGNHSWVTYAVTPPETVN